MYANYHTHTYHCQHAVGAPEKYVREAIANGLHILGFSDHMPQLFDNGYISNIRMRPTETGIYVKEINELRDKYRGVIDIYTGYEAEFYPNSWERTLEHIRANGCDYLILGQHFTNSEYDGVYVAKRDCDDALLRQYVDQSIEALKTGVFSAVAHPDVVRYAGDRGTYIREMTRLCETAAELSVPLELNLHGLYMARHYPSDLFWEIAAKSGAEAIIGCDAHDPLFVGKPELYEAGMQFLSGHGIAPIRELTLRGV